MNKALLLLPLLALSLHDRIVFNSRYRKEVSADGSASSILPHGEGLCECYTDCFYLLATMTGLECRRIGGEADGTGHAPFVRLRHT